MNANRPMTELLPPPSFAKPDIVRRFLAWAQSADAEARAEAASALARAYLHSELTRARARRSRSGDDGAARRPVGPGSQGAGGSFVPLQRGAASADPRAGGGRAGSGRRGASALARSDRGRPRRSRREWRRRRPDGARAPAQPAGRGGRCAGRERAPGCGSRADRQSRDRSSGRIAFSHLCPLQRRCERARGAA